MRMRTGLEDLLIRGLDDWTYLAEAARSVARGADPAGSVREATLALVEDALRSGLVVPGDVLDDGFHEWRLSATPAMARIREGWERDWGNEIPTPGAVVWLSNTPAGDGIARDVLTREAAEERRD